jgi:hypothetical protein
VSVRCATQNGAKRTAQSLVHVALASTLPQSTDNLRIQILAKWPCACAAFSVKRLGLRYRESDHTRHTSVSWNLIGGMNVLCKPEQHGHSVAVMLKIYAKWVPGGADLD